MKSFLLCLAGCFTLGTAYLLYSTANTFSETAEVHRELSMDERASSAERKHDEILGRVYSTAAKTCTTGMGFVAAIIHLIAVAALLSYPINRRPASGRRRLVSGRWKRN